MICYGCSLISICKVFEMATNMSPSINIVVNDCRVRPNGDAVVIPHQAHSVAKLTVRTQNDLLNISDRIKEATKKPDPETAIAEADAAIERLTINCNECGDKVFETVAIKCSACGKILCENCSTHDMGTKKTYCEKCWDDQLPAAHLPD
jgi:ribosomal protein L37E